MLSKADNPNAYLLLKVIQSYLELDMYTSMDVHTEKSIEEGRQLLGVFEANLKVSINLIYLYYTNFKAGLFTSQMTWFGKM